MSPSEARTLAWEVLRGERKVPRTAPKRIALARALPKLAEELRCTRDAPLALLGQQLRTLWDSLEQDEFHSEDFGTRQLGAGCLEAASLLGFDLPEKKYAKGPLIRFGRSVDFSSDRSEVARPCVLVPLANAAPVRVLYTTHPGEPSQGEDGAVRDTAALVQRLLGVTLPRWWLDGAAPGRSKMAALFLRALLEQFPEAEPRLFTGDDSWDRPRMSVLGITGELDADGLVKPVEALEDKVDRFFQLHPEGRLLVPASQWKQARAQFKRTCPPPARKEDNPLQRNRSRRWWRVQPFGGVLDLAVRLRLTVPGAPETALFEKLHRSSRRVPLWNGKVHDVATTVDLEFVRIKQDTADPESRERMTEEELLQSIHRSWLLGRSRPAFLEGGPGTGKSIALRRLAALLLSDTTLLGPALRVDARTLAENRLSLAQALRVGHAPTLREEECERLVTLAFSPAMAGSVWLIIDGLDEVSASQRSLIRGFADSWAGPVLMGARPLVNEAPGAPHFRICELDSFQQERIFALEGRPGHHKVLRGERASSKAPWDRRRDMVADLCGTPLGVSLLAMLPAEELGASLDVPKILRNSIETLLERAENSGRISRGARYQVTSRDGLALLGSAVWPMLRRGEATLTLGDLDAMSRQSGAQAAIREILDHSDLIQRAGPGRYQFSHKSLAEFCAACHLVQNPKSEQELLGSIGEPGPDAVAVHFCALSNSRERSTRFLRSLVANRHRPMSSLMLATRLLLASRPEQLQTEVVVDVLVRRLRLASQLQARSLPGGLSDTDELWLALGCWARELRPHAEALIAACSPEIGQFLSGELLPLPEPLRYPIEPGSLRPESRSFAERLAMTLGLELPLRILTRLREGKALLLERPAGPWITELESLIDAPEEPSTQGPVHTAASVWAQRASPERQLERLDMLSRCPPVAVQPVLETVLEQGSYDQKREAILRAALNSLEWGETDDEGDWIAHVRFARRFTGLSSGELLSQWERLWASGMIGDVLCPFSKSLERLYAEFIRDPCGPARWRALVAQERLREPAGTPTAVLTSTVRDPFRAVRIEALAQLARRAGAVTAADVGASLLSQDDAERWAAFVAIGAGKTAPFEFLFSVLVRCDAPQPRQERPPEEHENLRHRWTPWERAMRQHGESARKQLCWDIGARLGSQSGLRKLFELVEGPQGALVEELLSDWHIHPSAIRDSELGRHMLATGRPRQRLVAARAFPTRDGTLASYVDDPEPEIAARAQESLAWQRNQEPLSEQDRETASRRKARERRRRERRPAITSKALARHETFESLWKVLPRYNVAKIQWPVRLSREERRNAPPRDDGKVNLEWLKAQKRAPVLKRLRQLYQPHHQPLLIAGLEDEDLAPLSIDLLREDLPLAQVVPLMLRRGAVLERVLTLLQGTPHGSAAARFLCDAMLSGQLLPSAALHASQREDEDDRDFFQWRWCDYLAKLDGLAAFLPLLAPQVPESLRQPAIEHIQYHWEQWESETPRREDLASWARGAEEAQDEELREIALRTLALTGRAEDAERWRPRLSHQDLSPRMLAAVIQLVSRFPREADLPLFRMLMKHSPRVGAEAAEALARAGGREVVEELVQLLESPPDCLDRRKAMRFMRSYEPFYRELPWRRSVAEPIIQWGDASQLRRAAQAMADDQEVWRIAERHLRFPEHLLFLAGHLYDASQEDELRDLHDEALKLAERMIRQIGEEPARRMMLEASLWGQPFQQAFDALIEVHARDKDLLLARLREEPDHALALEWLSEFSSCEEDLDAVWREKSVPWWCPPGESPQGA